MQLPKVKVKVGKRLGRGYGSGRGGHTSGRGTKGQKARRKIHILFEGTKMKKSFIKRLPLRRGKGKFKSKNNPIIINVAYLEMLPTGTIVDIATLVKNSIVSEKDAVKYGVKILGNAGLTKKLSVKLPISKKAAKLIEKNGGKVELE
ncbi:50S ribosomal protein L15 [Candidatus Woesebacteria bacterium]|nr:MAG: 50S ribosomal protein L15 [Candidatus Woesebacteria bacterium]